MNAHKTHENTTDTEEQWKTVIDFTEIKKDGVPARQVLRKLERISGS